MDDRNAPAAVDAPRRSPADRGLPDFLIIGAAKAGTTSLYRWLGEQPECWLPSQKEPNFFSSDENWHRGVEWYRSLFAAAPGGRLRGEASVAYSHSLTGDVAAERIHALLPDARLVYLIRDPVSRLVSHYRHDVLRGRENEDIARAVCRPGNEYVAGSLYRQRLEPYTRRFERDQLCVVRLEDVIAEDGRGWSAVLTHLGLADRPRPQTVFNATTSKPKWRGPARSLLERAPPRLLRRLPQSVRSAGRQALTRPSAAAATADDVDQIPGAVVDLLADDAERLAAWLGRDAPLWDVRVRPSDG